MLLRASRDGGWSEAALLAEASGASERAQRVLKAAVAAGGMNSTDTGAIADLGIVSSGFLASLANVAAFDALLPSMIRIPLDSPAARVSTTVPTGYVVGEGSAKPVTRFAIAPGALDRRKAACVIVLTDELARSMSAAAQALLARELRKGVAAATDATFLAGITNGTTPVVATGDVFADVAALLAAIDSDSSSKFFLIVDSNTAKRLAADGTTIGGQAHPGMTPNGGTLAGVNVLVSDQIPVTGSPGAQIIMIDASGLAGDSGPVTLDQSREASLLMNDAPVMSAGGVGSPDTPTGASLVSLWQSNSRALRAERWFAFAKLRPDSVQVLSGAVW